MKNYSNRALPLFETFGLMASMDMTIDEKYEMLNAQFWLSKFEFCREMDIYETINEYIPSWSNYFFDSYWSNIHKHLVFPDEDKLPLSKVCDGHQDLKNNLDEDINLCSKHPCLLHEKDSLNETIKLCDICNCKNNQKQSLKKLTKIF